MSQRAPSPDPTTESSTRPPSAWTNDARSMFTDSAISVGSNTPKHVDEKSEGLDLPSSSDLSVSEHLTQLAAAAWAAEQDGTYGQKRKRKLQTALRLIEECLEGRGDDQTQIEEADPIIPQASRSRETGIEQQEVQKVQQALQETVASMRARHQEQRHLHQLAIRRLEAVAQTCLVQQDQVRELESLVKNLRSENQQLGGDNDGLRFRIVKLETRVRQKEIAIHAMSSAVTGLEGWIHPFDSGAQQSAYRSPPPRRGRIVTRGRGRFRAKYFVDDPEGDTVQHGFDRGDAVDLREGVTAWLRGFRDVQDEMNRMTPNTLQPVPLAQNIERTQMVADDDWGDFESVNQTQDLE